MSINTIEQDFMAKVSAEVRLSAEDSERFRVFTPFMFEDGDHFVIVLKKDGNRWILTDEAHTFMHLTYDIDEKLLHRGTRREIISKALSMFEVEDRNGELILEIQDGCYGEALFSFAQAILKIADVSYLTRERVQSTFMEDFHALLHEKVPKQRMSFNWCPREYDTNGIYAVDCRINGMPEPLFVYALHSNTRVRDAIIALQRFKAWEMPFQPLGIFEDREKNTRKVLACFDAVCEKQFHKFYENQEEIGVYLSQYI